MDFEVDNPEIEQLLRSIGESIKRKMPENWGFTLMLFNFGQPNSSQPNSMFYMSSARQDHMIRAMQQCITRLKAKQKDKGVS